MKIVPLTLTQANRLVSLWHRHSKPIRFLSFFAIGLENDRKIVGAVIVGRPISPSFCDGYTVEIKRLVTSGDSNACSMLYGAAWRAARALGYSKAITYTLDSESGASLRGAGWKLVGYTSGFSMNKAGDFAALKAGESGRGRVYTGVKRRWEIEMPGRVVDKDPYYFPHPEHDRIHRPAPLLYPPCGVSETGDTPAHHAGETGSTPEPPHSEEDE